MTYPEFTAERERDLDTFVSNNIIACLSPLFYDIGQHPEAAATVFDLDAEDIYDWFSAPDLGEAVDDILADLVFSELLDEADEVSYRDDALDSTTAGADRNAAIATLQDAYDRELAEVGEDDADRTDLDELEDTDLETWATDHAAPEQVSAYEAALRDYVVTHITDDDERRELCKRHNVDLHEYDREVYEHWAVDPWFGSHLQARGECVFEFGNLTIWGRCTTGQSISLDYVVQCIYDALHNTPR